MTTSAGRPPCPLCGEPRCILVRNHAGKVGETCGKRTCAAKLRAQRLGPAHYQKLQAAAAAHRKPRIRSDHYIEGYGAGRRTGYRTGFKDAKAEAQRSAEELRDQSATLRVLAGHLDAPGCNVWAAGAAAHMLRELAEKLALLSERSPQQEEKNAGLPGTQGREDL